MVRRLRSGFRDVSIRFDDLHKSFGTHAVLRGVSLEAKANDISFIIGPSGAGKSVTARHAAGLMEPDSGDVVVFGERLRALDARGREALRRRCAFVLQGAALLDGLSLQENVALGGRAKGLGRSEALAQARAMLERVGLDDERKLLPTECGPGVLMRAAIARALALSPEMIIYDEPTSGLDPGAARQVDALISEVKEEGIGALVISHDLTSICGIADHIHLLYEGRVYLSGSAASFRASADPVVRQFMDGLPDGPMPEW